MKNGSGGDDEQDGGVLCARWAISSRARGVGRQFNVDGGGREGT